MIPMRSAQDTATLAKSILPRDAGYPYTTDIQNPALRSGTPGLDPWWLTANSKEPTPPIDEANAGGLINLIQGMGLNELSPNLTGQTRPDMYYNAGTPGLGRLGQTSDALQHFFSNQAPSAYGNPSSRGMDQSIVSNMSGRTATGLAMQQPDRINALLQILTGNNALATRLVSERLSQIASARDIQQKLDSSRNQLLSTIPVIGGLVAGARTASG